jgi:uncharacterized membrane protein YtjA (UPF0391 family)
MTPSASGKSTRRGRSRFIRATPDGSDYTRGADRFRVRRAASVRVRPTRGSALCRYPHPARTLKVESSFNATVIESREDVMLKWGLVYFLLAVASGLLGVMDPNAATAGIAQVFFFGNVILFVVFTLLGSLYPQMLELPAETGPNE